jgi:hypothetical protein
MALDVMQMFVDSLDQNIIDNLTNDELILINEVLDKAGYWENLTNKSKGAKVCL